MASHTLQYPADKVRGILFGTFLGDALGAPFEGSDPDDIPPLDDAYFEDHPPRMYTDDTQMSLSVFEEMVEHGFIDSRSLMQRFLKRFVSWRQYGGGMLEVIEKWRDGENPESAASSLYGGSGSFGNGAAMRAAPISAFFKLSETNDLIEEVRRCSVLTHTHAFGISGAVLQAYAVLLALNNIPVSEWMSRFYSFDIASAFKINLAKVNQALERKASAHESVREIGNAADVLEAVPAALYASMRSTNFVDSVTFAVEMGGDTDTIGAMAGAIAGARFGYGSIPERLLRGLENEREGVDFILGLVDRAGKK